MTTQIDTLNLQTQQLRSDMADLGRLADSFGVRLVNAFALAVIQGRKLSDVLRGLALGLAQTALSQALRPLGNLLGGLLGGGIASARGNVFSGGRLVPFASGGIVNSPTLFPLRGGAGLMGEAGPEAIVPLTRGRDGRLGVRSNGGGINVTVNITTPDVQGFQRSQSQVAALMARAIARGQRNF
ncbi:MAG: phage tail tape measure protein [Rhizobiales bacterium]|nr:phage tail tape measure protein [Hyphomicrobiales bacterium]MBI3672360.1 phage tail tape measure protein [Hyphomicrobiales bacterium]